MSGWYSRVEELKEKGGAEELKRGLSLATEECDTAGGIKWFTLMTHHEKFIGL